ncbi:MucR family transcriptional regulator [Azorhizobium sp. AG788]|uniref:MucR family transcriptional regulator n=1 Tax=Azorhizobium sp. AG788 TaxID=2183897 RepID=UPI0031389593
MNLTVDIIAAYVGNNTVDIHNLPELIRNIHSALNGISREEIEFEEVLKPAVALKKSITPDFIICLEDGKKFKSLKRHIQSAYGLTPDAYRAKWGLPHDYPMVAPNYAAARSKLAKDLGLGRRPQPEPEPVKKAAARQRRV